MRGMQVAVVHDVEYLMIQVRDHGERLGNEVGKAAIPAADLPAGVDTWTTCVAAYDTETAWTPSRR